jgi:hypothetical protein
MAAIGVDQQIQVAARPAPVPQPAQKAALNI